MSDDQFMGGEGNRDFLAFLQGQSNSRKQEEIVKQLKAQGKSDAETQKLLKELLAQQEAALAQQEAAQTKTVTCPCCSHEWSTKFQYLEESQTCKECELTFQWSFEYGRTTKDITEEQHAAAKSVLQRKEQERKRKERERKREEEKRKQERAHARASQAHRYKGASRKENRKRREAGRAHMERRAARLAANKRNKLGGCLLSPILGVGTVVTAGHAVPDLLSMPYVAIWLTAPFVWLIAVVAFQKSAKAKFLRRMLASLMSVVDAVLWRG